MKKVDLSYQGLTTIPLLGSDVDELNFDGNSLSVDLSDETFDRLTGLKRLFLEYNKLTTIPNSIQKLVNLEELSLDGNKLTVIPDAIGMLKNLKKLSLNYNELTVIPDSILKLINLEELSLNNNQISEIPDAIGMLVNLKTLNIEKNRPLIQFPFSVLRLKSLKILNLRYKELHEIPKEIVNMSSLVELNLEGSKLDNFPLSVVELKNLERLNLGNTKLTVIPDEISKMEKLSRLDLHGNQLTTLPDAIGSLINLKALRLDHNQLKTLPRTIGNLDSLKELGLKCNFLTILPSEIGNLKNLIKLNLYENQLETLPDEIGNMKKLEVLNLKYNRLTEVPSQIGNLTNLSMLSLAGNRLRWLPASIERFKNILELGYEGNVRCLIDLQENPRFAYTASNKPGFMGRLELLEAFRGKVLFDDNGKFESDDEEEFLRTIYTFRKLHWNIDTLNKLRLNKVENTLLSENDMIRIVEKAAKTPITDGSAITLINDEEKTLIIDYIRMLHDSRIVYKKSKPDEKDIPLFKNILGFILEHLNQAIDSKKLDALQFTLDSIADCIKHSVDKQIAVLKDAYSAIQYNLSYKSTDPYSFIKDKIAALKDYHFRRLMTPCRSQNIHLLNYWTYELGDVFGFNKDFKSAYGTMGQDMFNDNRKMVAKAFLDYFTPESIIKQLAEEINVKKEVMNDLIAMIYNDPDLTDSEKRGMIFSAPDSEAITSNGVKHILLKMEILSDQPNVLPVAPIQPTSNVLPIEVNKPNIMPVEVRQESRSGVLYYVKVIMNAFVRFIIKVIQLLKKILLIIFCLY